MAWYWPFGKKDDAAEFDVEAQLEKKYSKDLLKAVNAIIRKVSASADEEKEFRPMPSMQREESAVRLKVLFSMLKKLDDMQRLEISQITDAMNSVMDPESRKDMDFDLRIEKRIENQTLSLEALLDGMLKHFRKTGDRRYVYNFLRIAAKILKGEIKAEKEKKKIAQAA